MVRSLMDEDSEAVVYEEAEEEEEFDAPDSESV